MPGRDQFQFRREGSGARRKPRICILADTAGWAMTSQPAQSNELRDSLPSLFAMGSTRLSFRQATTILCTSASGAKRDTSFSASTGNASSRKSPAIAGKIILYLVLARLTNLLAATFLIAIPRCARRVDLLKSWRRFSSDVSTPNGVNVTRFRPGKTILWPNLVFGWAGKPQDGKGFDEIVQPACGDRFPLRAATGDLSHRQMEKFYRDVDVIVVASKHKASRRRSSRPWPPAALPMC